MSLLVSFSYYIIIAAQPNKACQAEVEAQVSGFCYQILYLGSLCRRCVRGPWGRIKGRLEDPSGLSDCVDSVVGCEFVLTAVTVGGLPGWDGWWYFEDYIPPTSSLLLFLPIIAEVCEVRVAVGAFDQFAGFVKTWIRGILGGGTRGLGSDVRLDLQRLHRGCRTWVVYFETSSISTFHFFGGDSSGRTGTLAYLLESV